MSLHLLHRQALLLLMVRIPSVSWRRSMVELSIAMAVAALTPRLQWVSLHRGISKETREGGRRCVRYAKDVCGICVMILQKRPIVPTERALLTLPLRQRRRLYDGSAGLGGGDGVGGGGGGGPADRRAATAGLDPRSRPRGRDGDGDGMVSPWGIPNQTQQQPFVKVQVRRPVTAGHPGSQLPGVDYRMSEPGPYPVRAAPPHALPRPQTGPAFAIIAPQLSPLTGAWATLHEMTGPDHEDAAAVSTLSGKGRRSSSSRREAISPTAICARAASRRRRARGQADICATPRTSTDAA